MGGDLQFNTIKDWHLKNMPYKVMWMDKTGKIIYGNKQFCNRLGFSEKELLKLSIFDINPGTTRESWELHWEEVKTKGNINFKSVHQTKKGNYYDVEVYAQFFSNNGKNIICSIVKDISESSFYQNLLDHSQRITKAGGWKLNLQDSSIIVTEQALEIFDTTDSNDFLPGNVIHRFEETEKLKKLISQAFKKAIPYDEVLTLKTNGNSKKYIRCIADPIVKKDKIYNIIGTYQDVTSTYKKQEELMLINESLNFAKDMILWLDRDANLINFNNSFLDELGYKRDELLQMKIFDVSTGFSKADFNKNLKYLEEHPNETLTFDSEHKSKDGTSYPINVKINLLNNGNIIAILRDITTIKENESRLEEALQELSEIKNELEVDNQYLREEISDKINLGNIICQSEAYRAVLENVTQVAVTDSTVLITGESGTGKELLASAVHLNSLRNERPLIKVNCATLPKDLIESELFGHKKGAFTGAVADKAGKFSLADGGTIFLDEIGEIPVDVQPKLLRVLQEGEFDVLGGNKTIKVDVRVIAATNRNLIEMVKDGTFREDLYYRLNVFPIHNIPLRSRKEDIPMLAQFFLEKYSSKAGKSFKRLSKKTIDILMAYDFPGNIRELENLIERAVIIEKGTTLKPGPWLPKGSIDIKDDSIKTFEKAQRDHIIKALNHTNWRVSGPKGAAKILDMKDKTLFAKMKRLGIERVVILKKR